MSVEEDPVIAEHNIYVTTQLASYLHVLQVPGGSFEELESRDSSPTVQNCRYKTQHKLFELEVPLDTNHPTYSRERATEFAMHSSTGRIRVQGGAIGDQTASGKPIRTLKLAGVPIPVNPNSRLFVATCINDAMHMTPVDSVLALKPSLPHLDEADARTKSAAKKLTEPADSGTGVGDKLKALSVQFRKRETEEQMAARLSSYAYLQRQAEDESWINLQYFFPSSQESLTVCDRLTTTNTEQLIQFA